MKNKRIPSKLFLLSFFIPILVLSSMLIKPLNTTLNGKEITLATIPVDPRDIFYGDYVTLDLEIEEVNADLLEEKLKNRVEHQTYGDDIPVYVSLSKDSEGIYKATKVSDEKPDGIYIKGKMESYVYDNSWDEEAIVKESVHIQYGIERFYVEEGTGLELEDQARKGQVLVSAKVHNGYPILTDIMGVK